MVRISCRARPVRIEQVSELLLNDESTFVPVPIGACDNWIGWFQGATAGAVGVAGRSPSIGLSDGVALHVAGTRKSMSVRGVATGVVLSPITYNPESCVST